MGRERLLSGRAENLQLIPGYAKSEGWGQVYRDLWLMVGEELSSLADSQILSDEDVERISEAALYTASRFEGTRHEIRHSGDHVMVHFLVSVQEYLADGYFDTDEILALILHDVLEDTLKDRDAEQMKVEREQVLGKIAGITGDNVGRMVEALSKIRSSTLDSKNYEYIDTNQHLTNKQLLETLLDEKGEITIASLDFARKVWRVKAYDIRHNLRTIHHHKHHDGSANVTKQLAKARLARDYQVPIMYALGLEKEARVIEDLAMGIISPSLANVAAHRREVYGGGGYVSAVEKWWKEQLAKNQELAKATKPQLEMPRLYALQEEDWDQKIPKLVLKMGDKEAQRLWAKWSRMYPPVKGMDHQALYVKGTDPWLKVVDLKGYRLAVEVWTPEIEARRDGSLMALFAAKLANTDKNDPASYVQLAAELMNQYSQVGVIEMQDSKGSHVRINKGSRVLDLIYAIEGVHGLRRVTQVLIERDGQEDYLSLGAALQSGDRLIAYSLAPEDRNFALLGKFDLLSKRYSSGALIALIAYLTSEKAIVSEKEVFDRGYQILSWLYASRRGKVLDIYPVLVLGQEEYRELLYHLGGLKRRARNDQDFTDWMDIMDVYQRTGVLPDGDDRIVVEAILKVDQLIEARKRLPIVRVTLPSDAPYVIEKIGRIMKRAKVSAMPFRGETVFDPRNPLGTQAVVEIVLSDEDANKAFKLVKRLRKVFGDAQVECLSEEMRQAGDWMIE